jgi:hypothetical protein
MMTVLEFRFTQKKFVKNFPMIIYVQIVFSQFWDFWKQKKKNFIELFHIVKQSSRSKPLNDFKVYLDGICIFLCGSDINGRHYYRIYFNIGLIEGNNKSYEKVYPGPMLKYIL